MKVQLLVLGAALGGNLVCAGVPAVKKVRDQEIAGGRGGPGVGNAKLSTKALVRGIELEELMRGARKLQSIAYATPERNRVFGSKAHNATVDWLVQELEESRYYDVVKQKQVHLWSRSEATLTVNGESKEASPMTYSPSGNTEQDIVLVNNLGCALEDFPAGVAGKIALIVRGTCPFGLKAAHAGAAKAVGALIYNNIPGPLSGTLGDPVNPAGPYPPTVGLSKELGDDLATRVVSEKLTAKLFTKSEFQNRTTFNIIATSKQGNKNNVIAVGGHSDSVEAGPGINDDGSGIVGNLAVAKALTKFKVPNAVRFLFWTAEEYGLLGSQYYVDSLSAEEREKIRLYLNMDMTASPNYATKIYDGDGSSFNLTGPAGSAEIEKLLQKFYEDREENHVPSEFDGRSDYDAFISVGIPAGGVFTGAEGIKSEQEAEWFGGTAGEAYDPNYHGVGDTVDNLSKKAWLMNTQATAYVVATYALSTNGLPPKDPPSSAEMQTLSQRFVSSTKPFNGRCDDPHGQGRRCTY
ncbi:aminopeptidase [Paracoccidioides lutzii Pb01]|uniref:Peptide hydrolase n=1 Tax=Paracoccidioides lutzii (strain ATCC MYA-826 / Pb01) TaxID=502779 RepID=C1GQ60_PARBA|nr:aminopeptidase [Paracoccidioides lutzii Pb01]EEH37734.2 aminopeptidase [Paracoccidioides lutzii Pb01]